MAVVSGGELAQYMNAQTNKPGNSIIWYCKKKDKELVFFVSSRCFFHQDFDFGKTKFRKCF